MMCMPKIDQRSKQWRCMRCGFTDKLKYDFAPKQIRRRCDNPISGLGDWIAAVLAYLGITERRWSAFVLALKHWPEVPEVYMQYSQPDCGCTNRKEAVNIVYWKWRSKVNAAGWWIRHRACWLRYQLFQTDTPSK